jgi:hypothetical protein
VKPDDDGETCTPKRPSATAKASASCGNRDAASDPTQSLETFKDGFQNGTTSVIAADAQGWTCP